MLELKAIRKEYPAGEGKVEALKGIDLQLLDFMPTIVRSFL